MKNQIYWDQLVSLAKYVDKEGGFFSVEDDDDPERPPEGVFMEPEDRALHWNGDSYVICTGKDCRRCANGQPLVKRRLAVCYIDAEQDVPIPFSVTDQGHEALEAFSDQSTIPQSVYRLSFVTLDARAWSRVYTLATRTLQIIRGLSGEAAVKIALRFHIDCQTRSIVIDARVPIGRDFLRIFVSQLLFEVAEADIAVRELGSYPDIEMIAFPQICA